MTDTIYASSFGTDDFSKAFETGASGDIADAYRLLTYGACEEGAELELKTLVEALASTIAQDRVAQKILSVPVHDALANWRSVTGGGGNTEDEALGTSQAFQEAGIFARTYGCAAILPIVKDSEGKIVPPSIRLDTIAGKEGSYTIDRLLVSTNNLKLGANIEHNFYLDNYGWPKKLWIGGVTVHPSRVVLLGKYREGSYFDSIKTDLADYHEAKRRLQIAVRKNNTFVLETNIEKIRNQLQASQQAGGKPLTLDEVLQTRARALYENLNDVNVAVINDGEKIHNPQQTNIESLVKAVQMAKLILAGVADMPFSRLFGKGSSGLATSSDTDFDNYSQALDSLRANSYDAPVAHYDAIRAAVYRTSIATYTWNDTKAEEMRLRLAGTTVENNDTTNEGDS